MSSKTVVLLGAGASKGSDFELPTMQGFFELSKVPERLKAFLEHFYTGVPADQFDLEEVFVHLDISVQRLPNWVASRQIVDTIGQNFPLGELFSYLDSRLQIPPDAVCRKHETLFKSLQPADTIMTLNYDLVADQSLGATEKGVPDNEFSRLSKLRFLLGKSPFMWGEPSALTPREQEKGFYLKLHGSIDWLYCPNRECPNGKRIYSIRAEAIKEGQTVGRPCRLCGSALRPFLVAPVPSKGQVFEGRLGLIWRLALDELQSATKVIVIGVALTRSDFEFRWLIQQSRIAQSEPFELHIVNPEPKDRGTALRLFGRTHHAQCFESLEQYVGTLCG